MQTHTEKKNTWNILFREAFNKIPCNEMERQRLQRISQAVAHSQKPENKNWIKTTTTKNRLRKKKLNSQ